MNLEGGQIILTDTIEKLSKKQEKFLVALLNSNSIVEASRKAEISSQTGHVYLNDPAFNSEYKKIRRQIFQFATNKLQQTVDEAVEVLKSVMLDDAEIGATKVSAARTIISNAFKSHELDELDERIQKLEELMGG